MSDYLDNFDMTQFDKEPKSRLDEFFLDSLRPTSLVYIAWLMVALVMALGVYFVSRNASLASIYPALFVYYLIAFIHIVLRLKAGGKANILAPDILFLFFYTMFHLGYVTLYGLNIVPYTHAIFFYEESVPRAMLVVNLGLLGFLFGFELIGPSSNSRLLCQPVKIPTVSWGLFGIVIMTMALAAHLLALVFIGPHNLMLYGYGAIQNARKYVSPAVAMLLSQSNPLMLFGMVVYLVSSSLKYKKLFKSKIVLALVTIFIAIYILEGDRGPILWLGIPILLVRHYFIKRVKIRYLVIAAVMSLTLFAGLALVRKTVFAPTKMWQEYQYQKDTGILKWWSPFVEMGASFKVVTITTQDVPSKTSYWQGKSYLSAALHTLPFLEGYFIRRGLLGPFGYWPSKWVTTTYFGADYAGQAFTVAAEGYLNFGFPGTFILLMLCGFFVRGITVKFSKKPSAAMAFVMLGFLGNSIVVIRNHVQLITQNCFFIIVIAITLNLLCKNEFESAEEYIDSDYLE